MKQTLAIENMSCDHCVARVTDKLSQLAGVDQILVDLEKAEAVITTSQAYSQQDYQDALAKTIYKVTAVS
ncbi:heavy-metal-associated domain-containing protein [Enterococcus faecalis]|nr:heavy-metal-associated domain-containing protein [Enterococcus faecalis]